MESQDKDLLLKDLCARLPYGVIVRGVFINYNTDKGKILYEECDRRLDYQDMNRYESLKPYLRPMSSMTEEERLIYEYYEEWTCSSGLAGELIDWLNKNMFDYRGLIEKGLALKASKDMYGQRYFPDEFSSYEDYVKYLKEKGLAVEAPE